MDNPLVNALIGSGAVIFFGSCAFATCYRITTGHPWRRPYYPERVLVTLEVATPINVTTAPIAPTAVVIDLDPPPPNNQVK